MLRLGLRGARVRAEWINIWDDQAAAATRLRGGGGVRKSCPGQCQAMAATAT